MITLVLANGLDFALSGGKKKQISDKIEEIWKKLDNADFHIVVRGPLFLLDFGYNVIFGPRLFSKKECTRGVGIGIFLILIILIIDCIMVSIPKVIPKYPWEMIGSTVKVLDPINPIDPALLDENQKTANQKYKSFLEDIKSKEIIEKLFNIGQWLVHHDSLIAKSLFTIIIVPILLLVGGCAFCLSLIISRRMLQTALQLPSVIVLLSVSTLDIVSSICICLGLYIIIMPMYYLQFMPAIYTQIILLVRAPIVAKSIMFPLLSFIAMLAKPAWLGDIMVVAIVPAIILLVFIAAGLKLYPVHRPLYRMSKGVIQRIVRHDKGVMYAVACLASALITLITLITLLLPMK